jgi:carbamoylphosphate synthase large subunit
MNTMSIESATGDAMPANRPRILLTDTKRWAVGVRIGMVFAKLGCEVAMLCPAEGHPAQCVQAIHRRFRYRGTSPIQSVRNAIVEFQPDLILPTCDRGLRHLHQLHAQSMANGEWKIAECIEKSLGPAESFPVVNNRYALLELAREEGILIPDTVPLESADGLTRAARLGYPLVIKADGTWGGGGVKVAANPGEAQSALQSLSRRRGIRWLATQLLLSRDRGNSIDDWKHTQLSLIAQAWVDGRPANCAVACLNGKVLAAIAVEVVASNGDRGPASVIEVVDGTEMIDAAEKIARRLNLSGFFGLDFMISNDFGDVYLIEMNGRSTQPCSLELGTGRNLPAAMCAALTGEEEPETTPVTTMSRIAYFPKQGVEHSGIPEWSYYYDVPEAEPEFIKRLLNQWNDRAVLGQLVDRFRGVKRYDYRPASFTITGAQILAQEKAALERERIKTGTR